MVARWVALAVMLIMFAIVGIFVGAVLRSPPPVASIDNGLVGATRLTGRAGAWTVTAEITRSIVGAVDIVVLIADAEKRPATLARPTAGLRMIDMEMGIQPVPLEQEAPGRWRGSSRLVMNGRWRLQIDIDGASVVLPFEARFR